MKKFSNTFIVLLPSLAFYFTYFYIFDGKIDLWGAVRFYDAWIYNLSTLAFTPLTTYIPRITLVSVREIAAPEILATMITHAITQISTTPKTVYHIYNSILIFFSVLLVIKCSKQKLVVLVFFLSICVGYYEQIAFHMTHRLKISLIFLVLTFLAHSYSFRRLSKTFLIITVMCHFSTIFLIPIFVLLSNYDGVKIPQLKGGVLIYLTLLTISILTIGQAYKDIDENSTYSLFSEFFFNKVYRFTGWSFYDVDGLSIFIFGIFFVLVLMHILRILEKPRSRQLNILLLPIYIFGTLVILGTSRLLMVYYYVFLFIFILNFNYRMTLANLALCSTYLVLFFWSIIRSYQYGPINNLIMVFQ